MQKLLIGRDTLKLTEVVDSARVFEAITKLMVSLSIQPTSALQNDDKIDVINKIKIRKNSSDQIHTDAAEEYMNLVTR